MKTLVIAAHPNLAQSTVNQRCLAELSKHPGRYTVRALYDAYPDGKIDVAREQALVERTAASYSNSPCTDSTVRHC